jgi:hypothetical protein
MSTTNEWAATCERWAAKLREDNGGQFPDGLGSVVEELVDEYGVLQVLEAAQRAIALREARAEKLAVATVSLCDVARNILENGSSVSANVLEVLQQRADAAGHAAVRVWEEA